MTKEELKDRISMALKDPTLQQGFEIICKELSDLEKENAELKKNEFNARTCLELQQSQDKVIVQYMGDHLAQAKEIIIKFSEFVNNKIEYDPEHPQEHTDLWNELCEQAEQFLKEIEK